MVHVIEIGCVQNCHNAVDFFYIKNEFFDISQLLSKLSKYSFGSKLIIFGLELLGTCFFEKFLHEERQKGQFWPNFSRLRGNSVRN